MSFVVSIGKWGGFYFLRGYTTRLCLGWLALTFIPRDFDPLIRSALYSYPSASSIEQYGITTRPRPLSSFVTDGGTATRSTHARKE